MSDQTPEQQAASVQIIRRFYAHIFSNLPEEVGLVVIEDLKSRGLLGVELGLKTMAAVLSLGKRPAADEVMQAEHDNRGAVLTAVLDLVRAIKVKPTDKSVRQLAEEIFEMLEPELVIFNRGEEDENDQREGAESL